MPAVCWILAHRDGEGVPLACALRRVAVVENFPRVFLEGQLGATHQTAGEQLPELIICPQPP